ncbi:hypothetical protein KI387_030130 [Taxus chinensis]|uniref:Zinc-finger domain-containing protein n=1 Tax=Taxus chinensis TaxID=29808 RepID=A0AA38FDC9_TAXCH|nr:hypothetical protein KI387_030130 [Taxus chinensis]
MGKLRSRKSEETCLSVTPPSASHNTNAYESLRLERIAQNQARMAALGVQQCAGELKSYFKVTKSPSSSSARKAVAATPIRRSQRLKDKSPSMSFAPGSGKMVLFEAEDDEKSLATTSRRSSARNKIGEARPANAPIPMCSPAELQLSPDLLARRCDSKSRGSIYDPILGLCCHFCRQKKLCGEEGCERCGDRDGTKACLGKTDCSVCHSSMGVFCRACLKIRYGEDIEEVKQNKNWMCPHCSEQKGINPYWICNRTGNNQSLQLGNEKGGDDNPLWLNEAEDKVCERLSQDGNGRVNHFGVELLGLCSLYDMVICNGMKTWPRSSNITCKTYNGQSVVDYVICTQSTICRLLEFEIGDCPIELKSDHNPLLVKLGTISNQQGKQVHRKQETSPKQGKIILNKENQEIFVAALEQQFQMARNDIESNTNKGASGYVCSKLLLPLIHKALSA